MMIIYCVCIYIGLQVCTNLRANFHFWRRQE